MKTYLEVLENFEFIVLMLISISNTSPVPLRVCVTKECNEAAAFITSNMDPYVDPCDDFYQFTCGRFKPPKTERGKSRKNVDIFILVEDKIMKQLLNILSHTSTENKPLRLAAQYFNTCKQDVSPAENQMKLIYKTMSLFDGWPYAKWTKKHSFIETLKRLRNLGFEGSYVFRVDVDRHPHSPSKMLLELMPPKFGLDPEILQKGLLNIDVQGYFHTWLNISKQFNSFSANPVKDKLLKKKLKEYVQFEVELAKIVSSLDAPFKFEIVDVGTVEKRYTSMKWSQVIQAVAGPVIQISKIDKVAILPEFMIPFDKLLKKKSKKLINDFVIGRAIVSSVRIIDYLQLTPKEKFCLITASEKFTGVLASRYVSKYFQEDKRNYVDDMAQGIKTELYKSISNCDWLDSRSKSHALEKLNNIKVIIGYSNEQLESDSFYNDVYEKFQINTQNLFESTLSLLKMELDMVFGSLRNARLANVVDPLNVFEVNGQYMPYENSVFIKAGAMQGMFYSENRPNYLNYGFVGFIIGHEFSHAFDSHVNGSRTLNENMADYEGIKSAYHAYNTWLKGETEEKLSKLPYTNQQMFWISAATMWCSQFSTQGLNYLLDNSLHTPPNARINVLLSNIKEFSDDFHCPVNSSMNPSKKCEIWR